MIETSTQEDGDYIDSSSRKKGPAKRRSSKVQMKNARERANEINRMAVDKFLDISRMKEGVEKDRRTSSIMELGKEMHFL